MLRIFVSGHVLLGRRSGGENNVNFRSENKHKLRHGTI